MTNAIVTNREIHVRAQVSQDGDGSLERPFSSIQQAADIALPGDRVIVHDGVYREWVAPKNGGADIHSRIVYEAAEGEHPVIKGSEIIDAWVHDQGTVWKAEIPNALFGNYNPFDIPLEGDWLEQPNDWKLSLGDVYLDGRSLFQARTYDDVCTAVPRQFGPGPDWVKFPLRIPDVERTRLQWYAEVTKDTTIIWANFADADPNRSLVEINVRAACFMPIHTGIDYITVRGFEMAHAACQWAPPTADQPGMVGPHWAKGWIIEDNHLHDAKCSAISLGKEYSTGNNEAYYEGLKPGYQCQLETVFRARHYGWDKERVGSHVVRNNIIHDCGQNGVVGHLGCINSLIEHNDIHDIGTKYEYFGHEIAGIKLHAAIDVIIRNNNIHDCILGTWLDWQAQGTRVTSNVYHRNVRDFMIEVTHGPCLIDNNVFASSYNFDNAAQGTAYVHNLFCGSTRKIAVTNRFTPYHLPHSTRVLGTACVYGNDDRIIQNIFAAAQVINGTDTRGTDVYDGAPASEAEYVAKVHSLGIGDLELFEQVPQPAYIDGNVYLNGTESYDREIHNLMSETDPHVHVVTKDDGTVWCELTLNAPLDVDTRIIDTDVLGVPRLVRQRYENPDGTPLVIDRDINGIARKRVPTPGPFEELSIGHNLIRVF
ncbi:right-handed parallel beta-helix repeat-containing protein [Bifidobacterium felsineum]|uniref:Uncharacterized protein n=1 Tax=Bifidobacterium felsineum TaxID=2045440 RepID=A0A2M9HM18_9BIFI|nr:right-handed parallel beta-helix repeat-containing protein [Bifidobacterium felsineum]PJM77857.1 hypothetical protein CSQ86_02070 [Bifidobacterium felsineum]